MNKLHFNFTVDRENNTMTIEREFAGNRLLVWDCHTKSDLLNQWFAPSPFTTKTKSMDFSEGGHWIYAMIDPNGTEYWARMDYDSISPIDSYSLKDGFCDEDGVLNPQLPRSNWHVTFTDKGEHTMVRTIVTYDSLADLETTVQMGMEEGMASTLNRLDDLLQKLQR